MNLMHLIKSYSYLKFFVDVYDEYIKECPETEDCLLSDIGRKNETAKTFLSYIEMALAVLPINTRSNYNNQYEFVYRKAYMEQMKIKNVAKLLNTSCRNAYTIRARALEMIASSDMAHLFSFSVSEETLEQLLQISSRLLGRLTSHEFTSLKILNMLV